MRSFLSRMRRSPARSPSRAPAQAPGQRQAPPAQGQAEIYALLSNSDSDAYESDLQSFVQAIQNADPQAQRRRAREGNHPPSQSQNIEDTSPGAPRPFRYDDSDSLALSPPASLLIEQAWPEAASSPLYPSSSGTPPSPGPYRPRQWELLRNLTGIAAGEYNSDGNTLIGSEDPSADHTQGSIVEDNPVQYPRIEHWLDHLGEPSDPQHLDFPDDNNNNSNLDEEEGPSRPLEIWPAYNYYDYEVASQANSAGEGPSNPAPWLGQNTYHHHDGNEGGQAGHEHPHFDTSALSFSIGDSGYFSVHIPNGTPFSSPTSSPVSSYHASSSNPSEPERVLRGLREEEQVVEDTQEDE